MTGTTEGAKKASETKHQQGRKNEEKERQGGRGSSLTEQERREGNKYSHSDDKDR